MSIVMATSAVLEWFDVGTKVLTGGASVLVSYLLYLINKQNNERLARQHRLERDQSLDIKMSTYLTWRPPTGGAVLQIEIQIKNISKERWCIPAVYLSMRAVPVTRTVTLEQDYDGLPQCDLSLGGLGNIAHVANSIKHLSPDEVEVVTCTFQFTDDFLKKHPVIALRSRIFAAGGDVLGPLYLPGNMRNEWIQFTQANDCQRSNFCFLERWAVDHNAPAPAGLAPGRLYILDFVGKGLNSTPDVPNTVHFQPVLQTTNRWHIYRTVTLLPPAPLEASRTTP